MAKSGRNKSASATRLHPRNPHRGPYDFERLVAKHPPLAAFTQPGKSGNTTVNFFDPEAVKALNTALLKTHYGITDWSIPDGYLCPPIPGRADYLHHAADLLFPGRKSGAGIGAYRHAGVRCLDIGVGANCIYPIIGNRTYDWSFVGSDINEKALQNAQHILNANPSLREKIELRLQPNAKQLLPGIVQPQERFELTLCNPPFHASAAAARTAQERKLKNLKGGINKKDRLNFGGRSQELWTEGGEKAFLRQLIEESRTFATQCYWFTTLVSREAHLPFLRKQLELQRPTEVQVIKMGQGQKKSRILAWTFLTGKQRKGWDGWLRGKRVGG